MNKPLQFLCTYPFFSARFKKTHNYSKIVTFKYKNREHKQSCRDVKSIHRIDNVSVFIIELKSIACTERAGTRLN